MPFKIKLSAFNKVISSNPRYAVAALLTESTVICAITLIVSAIVQ